MAFVCSTLVIFVSHWVLARYTVSLSSHESNISSLSRANRVELIKYTFNEHKLSNTHSLINILNHGLYIVCLSMNLLMMTKTKYIYIYVLYNLETNCISTHIHRQAQQTFSRHWYSGPGYAAYCQCRLLN